MLAVVRFPAWGTLVGMGTALKRKKTLTIIFHMPSIGHALGNETGTAWRNKHTKLLLIIQGIYGIPLDKLFF